MANKSSLITGALLTGTLVIGLAGGVHAANAVANPTASTGDK